MASKIRSAIAKSVSGAMAKLVTANKSGQISSISVKASSTTVKTTVTRKFIGGNNDNHTFVTKIKPTARPAVKAPVKKTKK
jgi:stage V sporulation protein SpoVS